MDFVKNAQEFLLQTAQRRWRPSDSLFEQSAAAAVPLRIDELMAPPFNKTPVRQLEQTSSLVEQQSCKPVPKRVNSYRTIGKQELLEGWTRPSEECTDESLYGIDAWRDRISTGNCPLSIRCAEISCSVEKFEKEGLAEFLVREHHRRMKERNGTDSKTGTKMRLTHSDTRSAPSDLYGTRPGYKLTRSTTMCFYPNRNNSPKHGNIPCRNFDKLHKHTSYGELQRCNSSAKVDTLSKYPMRNYTSSSVIRVENKDEPSVKEIKANDSKSRHKIENFKIEQNLLSSTPSQSEEEISSNNVLVQEFVDKLHKQNTRSSPVETNLQRINTQLPSLSRNNQSLVESILSYQHSGSRTNSRYSNLTPHDVRRATMQMLTRESQRREPTQIIDSKSEVEIIRRVDPSLAKAYEAQNRSIRVKSMPQIVVPKKVSVQETIPNIGVKWKMQRFGE